MRAVVIERFGDPDGLAVVEVPTSQPDAGQVVIRTEAIGVGGVDAVIRRGTLGGYGFVQGHVPGGEVAGVVSAVGAEVDPRWVGRRVWASTGTGGGYVEHARVDIGRVIVLPDGLSAIEAVTLGSSAAVAHFALAHARFAPGESMLVRGAAGSIGIAAVEIAAGQGASSVAVTTSSEERGRRLRQLGATHVLDRKGAGDATAPTTFDVIVDIVSGPDVPLFLDRLAPNGRFVAVGAVAGMPPADFGMGLLRAFQQSRSYATFSLDSVPADDLQRVRAAQFAAAARGELHPVVDRILPLEAAAEAHRLMDDGAVFGRIVLTP